MGHATRSRVAIEHLLARGHTVHIVASHKAHAFLRAHFDVIPNVEVDEIGGLTLHYDANVMKLGKSLLRNLKLAPENLRKSLETYRSIVERRRRPDLVVSDFESFAYLYGRMRRIPVISLDNMQILDRCAHPPEILEGARRDYRIARYAVKAKLPGAYHYLVTSFFFPPVKRPRTTLLPPILRPEILAAERAPGEHVLVYLRAMPLEGLLPVLEAFPEQRFRVYGYDHAEVRGHVSVRPFSQEGFVEDLRTARAVVAGGGFSLMCEAVHLHVPMLAVPIGRQFEQELNARWLAYLGYGDWAKTLSREALTRFLHHLPAHAEAVSTYQRHDNGMLYACLDELLRCVELDEPPPPALKGPHMGTYQGPLLEEERRGRHPKPG